MQTYANHAHRPYLWGTGFLCWLALSAGWGGWLFDRSWGLPLLLTGLVAVTAVLLLIGRVYVTRLQDRIILLEMQVRGARLLSPAQQARLASLPTARVVALRFASDAELPALLDRAVADDLSADAIKRAVTTWRADHLRT